jgi:hypothetical protein
MLYLTPPLVFCLLVLNASVASAQTPSQTNTKTKQDLLEQLAKEEQKVAPAATGKELKIQRIRTEDGGSRIDELRVGGETQSITVQPKANVPPWEVQPTDGARSRPDANDKRGGETGAPRVWNVMKF